jgi:hypothetical protein
LRRRAAWAWTSVARTLAAEGSRKTGGADEGPALTLETIRTWDSRVAATLAGGVCGRIVCAYQVSNLRSPSPSVLVR